MNPLIDWITKNSVPISSKKDNSNDIQLALSVYVVDKFF